MTTLHYEDRDSHFAGSQFPGIMKHEGKPDKRSRQQKFTKAFTGFIPYGLSGIHN